MSPWGLFLSEQPTLSEPRFLLHLQSMADTKTLWEYIPRGEYLNRGQTAKRGAIWDKKGSYSQDAAPVGPCPCRLPPRHSPAPALDRSHKLLRAVLLWRIGESPEDLGWLEVLMWTGKGTEGAGQPTNRFCHSGDFWDHSELQAWKQQFSIFGGVSESLYIP